MPNEQTQKSVYGVTSHLPFSPGFNVFTGKKAKKEKNVLVFQIPAMTAAYIAIPDLDC